MTSLSIALHFTGALLLALPLLLSLHKAMARSRHQPVRKWRSVH
ncbi:MAG: hypothetical protein AB7P20_23840 [Rhizobiaceae bacterium]